MTLYENYSLRELHTFHSDVKARYFARFQSVEELADLAVMAHPLLILGGGSNLLFRSDFDGLVLKNELKGIEVVHEDEAYIYLRAGAGENWHQLVVHAVERGWGGLENLSLIPGCAGAAPMQNIGAYGVELEDVFWSLEAFHLKDKKTVTFSRSDCAFGYRESVFKQKYKGQFVILNITLRLHKTPIFHTAYGAIQQELERMGITTLSVAAISRAVINIRQSKLPDPAITGNAGSFFKNPVISGTDFEKLKAGHPDIAAYPQPDGTVKLAAGWLIEQCGWKGFRRGDAGCHEKQALVLVNYGNASGKDIFALSEDILQSVHKTFQVKLEREVNIY